MQLNQATIMVVEDEPVLREIIGAWFARISGKVVTASNGAEALETLAFNPVHLVISDVRMPVMDGVTLLKKIMASAQPLPGVILITGFSDIDARHAYGLGAEAFLHKPMEREELMEAVKRGLMSRAELWSTPVDNAPPTLLEMNFDSLAAALDQNKIAFGRGGFCIAAPQSVPEGPIEIRLNFEEEKKTLDAIGIVRWSAPAEPQCGIELLCVAPESRDWLSRLIAQTGGVAFIPASPDSRRDLLAQTA